MSNLAAHNSKRATQPALAKGQTLWTEAWLRRAVETLQRRTLGQSELVEHCPDARRSQAAVDGIVRLGMQPEVLAALRGRRDPAEAVGDLATRYAFAALMVQGKPFHELDRLSQALIQHTLDVIYKRAFQVAERSGEDPLDEDAGLLLSICKSLSHYIPRKPMGAHISWKLQHYEGAVSRAMRQIENLVRCPAVIEAFAAFVLAAAAPDELKAHLLQLARGGGRGGVPCEAVIRFFARPATAEFVKGLAGTVQTARTLYGEEEYRDLPWHGARRLPDRRRQGYLEAALASLERRAEVSLDSSDVDLHDLRGADPAEAGERAWLAGSGRLRSKTFERWVTRCALEARPDDALWQAAEMLYIQGLTAAEIVQRGLADPEALAMAEERMAALRADRDVWQAWMEDSLGNQT